MITHQEINDFGLLVGRQEITVKIPHFAVGDLLRKSPQRLPSLRREWVKQEIFGMIVNHIGKSIISENNLFIRIDWKNNKILDFGINNGIA